MNDNINKMRIENGQLLLEVLISIGAVAIIAAIAGQLIYVGMRGNKSSSEINVALGLSEGIFEAVRGISTEQWKNIYNLSKGIQDYYPLEVSGRWTVATGTENIIIGDNSYSRYFFVKNVCRDSQTKNITGFTDSDGSMETCVSSGGVFDPSTQGIAVYVAGQDMNPIFQSEYITRWENKICVQTDWTSQGSGSVECPAATYSNSSNITPGAVLQLCPGGC